MCCYCLQHNLRHNLAGWLAGWLDGLITPYTFLGGLGMCMLQLSSAQPLCVWLVSTAQGHCQALNVHQGVNGMASC
jgi:hypothetical protein